jgi:hypothetical protein
MGVDASCLRLCSALIPDRAVEFQLSDTSHRYHEGEAAG